MKRIISFLIFTTFFIIKLPGQQATATIGTITSCHNSVVIVPLNVENFLNIGAMSLYIGYDTAQLTFQTIENIHRQFQGLIFNGMFNPEPQVGISYTSVYGTSLASGKLFDMKFMFKYDSTALVFNAGCEIVTPDFEVIEVNYTNGGVDPLIDIVHHPDDVIVYQPGPAAFSITRAGAGILQWQRSTNGGQTFSNLNNSAVYQGVNTDTLHLLSTNQFLNGTIYRCMITGGSCVRYSDIAKLTVLIPVEQPVVFEEGWNSFSSYLNPMDPSIDNMFSSVLGSLEIIISADGIYYPDGGIYTLDVFDPAKGYAIKMSNDAVLVVVGSVLSDKTLLIPAGWSYLPVITNCGVPVDVLFNGVMGDIGIIKELAGSKVYWPAHGIYTLQLLEPGKAYQVMLVNPVQVTYPDCDQ